MVHSTIGESALSRKQDRAQTYPFVPVLPVSQAIGVEPALPCSSWEVPWIVLNATVDLTGLFQYNGAT
jgi:hypothetical protein